MCKILHKSRKYPIIKDEYGRSLRKRCFERFEEGLRPAQIARELNMIPQTTYRYFECWKKLPKDLDNTCTHWRKEIKNDSEFSNRLITMLSETLGTSEEQVIIRLQQPWGIKTLLKVHPQELQGMRSQSIPQSFLYFWESHFLKWK